jgi:LacI family transcriptional regulator
VPHDEADRPVTIYTVAKLAGVSISSVSRVLQGSAPASEATRHRVMNAVEQLGYSPLRGRSTQLRQETHGFVTPSVVGPYYAELLAGYLSVAGPNEVSVRPVVADTNPGRLIEQVVNLSGMVDGMAITHLTVPDEVVKFVASRIPVVMTGRNPIAGCDSIGVENGEPTAALVRHLLGHGIRRPRFVGISETRDVRQRYSAYLEAVMQAGLDVPMAAFKVPAIERFGMQVADEVLAEADHCDALVCANDELAMSVMKALWRRGLRCPDDILITGFDDIMLARYTTPGLTTVRQPIQTLASMLAQRLHERITTGVAARESMSLTCEVVIRGSCGCPE